MFEIRTEGFTKTEAKAIKDLTKEVVALATKATSGYNDLRVRYFGTESNSKTLQDNLNRMDKYFNDQCTLITYVKKEVGHQVDSVAVDPDDYGQVIPNINQTTANFKATQWHVSSGLRVFTMNEYFNAVKTNDREEMVNYVYHEISHKVLDTVDYKYGESSCRKFAIKHPSLSVKNADSYGYFLAAIDARG